MKFFTKISLLALLLSAVFNINALAQEDAAERFDTKNIVRNEKPNEKEKASVFSREPSVFEEIAQASGYTFSTTTTGSLTDMTTGATGIITPDQDDTASAVQNIGFEFYFMGTRYTQFSANSNGLMRLGSTQVQGASPYKPLAQLNIPLITAYGADQRTLAVTGIVRYKVIGAAPNRTLVVEWFNMQSNFNSGGTADLTYQVRLSETTGVIEFVYGSMTMSTAGAADPNSRDPHIGFSSSSTAGTVGSVTAPQAGVPSFNGASNDPVENLYTAGAITVLSGATDGARRTFTFTPPVPAAPTALNFTGVTATSITLNWTDSPDEDVYAIYRSTDGVNYTFVATVAENVVTYTDSGRNPSTNYFYQVYSVSEGALSATALSGSQTTAPAGSDSCSGTPTNWTAPTSWADGTVPTSGDNVTIQSGCTMTIDTATPTALSVTVQNGGTLIYSTSTASTLTVSTDVTIDSGGTFNAGTGVLQTHVLNIGGTAGSGAAGNLTVNGTFDMFGTASVATNFFGSANGTVSGSGATADFFSIIVNKGTGIASILDVTRVITLAAPTSSANRLTITNGTFKLSSASTLTPYFGSQTIAAATGRLWLNNAGATVTAVGVGTTTGAGSPTIAGALQIDAGTFGYGSGNNTMTVNNGGTIINNGGTINMFGAVTISTGANFTMTAGNFNVDPQAANTLAATGNIFRFNAANVQFTGGTLTIVDPHAATGSGTAFSISASSAASFNFVGSTIQFGNGVSTTAGSIDGFDIDTFVGLALVPIDTVLINNTATNAATRFVRAANALPPNQQVYRNLTITNAGGSEFRLNGHLIAISGNVVNNGVINGNTASSNLYFNGTTAQTFSGTGVTGTVALPMVAISFDSTGGVTFDPAMTNNVITKRVNLFTGNVFNSGKITLGNNNAVVNIVQIGNSTTPTAAGTFDAPFTFDLGAGGQTVLYLRTTANRTTGGEINPARVLTALTFDENTAGRTLSVAGGNITVTGALTLTNGIIVTNAASSLTHNGTATRTNGYVDGPLTRDWAVATGTTYTFHVGEGVYSPVGLASIVDGDAALTAEAFNATLAPFPAANAISRNWSLTKSVAGTLTADVSFTYDQTDDVPVTADETDFRLFRRDTGDTAEVCATACVDEGTNVATATGISTFSRWTVAQAFVPTSANVNIGGRVMLDDGVTGVSGATLVLTGGNLSQPLRLRTNPFGYYNFEGLAAGQTYIVTVRSKQHTFTFPTKVLTPTDNIADADFVVFTP